MGFFQGVLNLSQRQFQPSFEPRGAAAVLMVKALPGAAVFAAVSSGSRFGDFSVRGRESLLGREKARLEGDLLHLTALACLVWGSTLWLYHFQ
ncbi:MAG: hypothetical protein M2R45_00855 [Verrucomicrobia subdivision 3 bacterium]|nr:hypothetical protein [Limisphaerales bacterium]MCS1413039.1 hypothetical protein [Limisphaerales bacterium]